MLHNKRNSMYYQISVFEDLLTSIVN